MTWQEVKIRNERRAIEIFQHFISFLEIYGQENFGENVEINWPGVYSNCVEFGLFDENPDVEEIVNVNSEEEFRDKMFSWIEKQVLDGYPIWRLFKLNNWLYEQLEKELHENEYKKDVEYFNKYKCFTCKYFYDDIYWLDKESKLMYYPDATVIHKWEKGSYKNKKLFKYHLKSMRLYFKKWGYKFF